MQTFNLGGILSDAFRRGPSGQRHSLQHASSGCPPL